MIQEVKVSLPRGWGHRHPSGTPSLPEVPAGLQGDGPSLGYLLGAPGSGPHSSLPRWPPPVGSKYRSYSRTGAALAGEWAPFGPLPFSSQGELSDWNQGLRASQRVPLSGLELELEVQGDPSGVSRPSINVSWAMLGLGGEGGKRSPPPHPCRDPWVLLGSQTAPPHLLSPPWCPRGRELLCVHSLDIDTRISRLPCLGAGRDYRPHFTGAQREEGIGFGHTAGPEPRSDSRCSSRCRSWGPGRLCRSPREPRASSRL